MNIPIETTTGHYVTVSQGSDGIRLEILGTGTRLAPSKLTLSLSAAVDLAEEIDQAVLDYQDESGGECCEHPKCPGGSLCCCQRRSHRE